MQWTSRDSIGCIVVPAISAGLCAAGSSLDALRIVIPLGPQVLKLASDSRPSLFFIFFALTIATHSIFYLIARLTYIENLAAVRHRRLFHLTFITSAVIFSTSLFSTLLNTILVGDGNSIDRWYHLVTNAMKGRSEAALFFGLTLFFLAAQSVVAGFTAARWFPPTSPDTPEGYQSNTRNIAGTILFVTVLFATVIPLSIKWRIENERAGCIMNIRNVQQAMRSYHGMNSQPHVFRADIVGSGKMVSIPPTCPGGGSYSWTEGQWVPVGELMLRCSNPDHVPTNHSDW